MTPASGREEARAWVCELHERALAWLVNYLAEPHERTAAYVDLQFAYCMARIGWADGAWDRLQWAKSALAGLGGAHECLYHAFAHRVRQALDGEPISGPLP